MAATLHGLTSTQAQQGTLDYHKRTMDERQVFSKSLTRQALGHSVTIMNVCCRQNKIRVRVATKQPKPQDWLSGRKTNCAFGIMWELCLSLAAVQPAVYAVDSKSAARCNVFLCFHGTNFVCHSSQAATELWCSALLGTIVTDNKSSSLPVRSVMP